MILLAIYPLKEFRLLHTFNICSQFCHPRCRIIRRSSYSNKRSAHNPYSQFPNLPTSPSFSSENQKVSHEPVIIIPSISLNSSSLGHSPITLSKALNLSCSPRGSSFVVDNASRSSLLNISLYFPNFDKTFGTGVSQSNIAMCREVVDITCFRNRSLDGCQAREFKNGLTPYGRSGS